MEKELCKVFATNMMLLRESNSMTQSEIAEAIDISRSSYSAYERQKRLPGFKVLIKLSLFYKIPISYFFNSNHQCVQTLLQYDTSERDFRLSLMSQIHTIPKDELDSIILFLKKYYKQN